MHSFIVGEVLLEGKQEVSVVFVALTTVFKHKLFTLKLCPQM